MKAVIIAALMAASVTSTADASLPPDAGSPDLQEIEMHLVQTSQGEDTVCQIFVPRDDEEELSVVEFPVAAAVEHDLYSTLVC